MSKSRITITCILSVLLSGCAGPSYKAGGVGYSKTITASGYIDLPNEIVVPEFEAFGEPAKIPNFKNYHSTQLLPANHYALDEDTQIEVEVSKYGYTRFSLEDERITDLFIYPQETLGVKLHPQGYLVLVPNSIKDDQEEVYVTISGEEGTTQDFFLRFTGKAPEPVKFVKVSLAHKSDN